MANVPYVNTPLMLTVRIWTDPSATRIEQLPIPIVLGVHESSSSREMRDTSGEWRWWCATT